MTDRPAYFKRLLAELRRRSVWQVLGVYLVTGWVVLGAVGTLADSLRLPDWAAPMALFLLIIGLPIVLATALLQDGTGSSASNAGPSDSDADIDDGEQASAETTEHTSPSRMRDLLTWRNAILGGVFAFLLLFGIAGLYVVIQDRGSSFAPQEAMAESTLPAVAVMPFEVQGEDLAVFGEGMVSLLYPNLDGAGGLRATPSRTILSRWKETVGATGTADLETVLAVAGRAGGSYAVVGSVVAMGSGMRLSADIYDVNSGEALGHAQVQGSSEDDVFALVDELSLQIVGHLAVGQAEGAPPTSLAAATTSSVEALKAFIEGETSFYRSDYGAAEQAFLKAVEFDSTFAMAYLRLKQAQSWQGQDVTTALEQVQRYSDRLPKREQLFVDFLAAVPSQSPEDGLREHVRQHPEDAEAWYWLAETYLHYPSLASAEETYDALSKAVALAPDFATAYEHMLDLASLVSNDSAHTAARAAEWAAIDPSRTVVGDIFMALRFGDGDSRTSAISALDTLAIDVLLRTYGIINDPRAWSAVEPYLQIAIERADEFPGGFVRLNGPYFLALAAAAGTGRLAEGVAYLQKDDFEPLSRAAWLADMYMLGLPVSLGGLNLELDPESPRELEHQAWLAWLQNDVQTMLESARTLRRLAAEARDSGDSTRAQDAGERMLRIEALGQIDRQDPHSTVAALGSHLDYPRARWLVAQAFLDSDMPADAVPLLLSLWARPGYSALANRYLGRAYKQLGQDDKARAAYAFFIEAWENADPELQPWVQEARDALARLGPLDQ
ncbi:MAG: hypothetical protein ABFS14_09490 [Gemmatimonadota bacterium]